MSFHQRDGGSFGLPRGIKGADRGTSGWRHYVANDRKKLEADRHRRRGKRQYRPRAGFTSNHVPRDPMAAQAVKLRRDAAIRARASATAKATAHATLEREKFIRGLRKEARAAARAARKLARQRAKAARG